MSRSSTAPRVIRVEYKINGDTVNGFNAACAALGVTRAKLDWMVRKGEIQTERVYEGGLTDERIAELTSEPTAENIDKNPETPEIKLALPPWEQDPAELADLRAEVTPRSLPVRVARHASIAAPQAILPRREIALRIATIRQMHAEMSV